MARLHEDEIAHYRREGWVVPRFRLPPARVAAMVDALEALLRRNPGVRPEKLVSAHIEGDNGEGVRGSRAFLDLARDPEIVELVSGVLGEDVILWAAMCSASRRSKATRRRGSRMATTGRSVHWPPAPRGSRWSPRQHQRMAHVDEAAAHDIELEPGELSLHDVYMIHGARANTSGRRRTGAALRYMPATSVFERDLRPVDGKSGVPVNFARRPLWKLPEGWEFEDVAAVAVDSKDRVYVFNRGEHPMMGQPAPYMSGTPFHRCTHTALSPAATSTSAR